MEPRLVALNWQAFRGRDLFYRFLSSLVLVPLSLFGAYEGGFVCATFVAIVALLGLREWLRLMDAAFSAAVIYFSYAALLITLGIGIFVSIASAMLLLAGLTLILFKMALPYHKERAGWVTLGLPYMAGFGLAILGLRETPNIGLALLMYLFAVVWGTDVGAYIVGRLVGGPKLAPTISPNKTWAGLAGGMVLAALCGWLVADFFKAQQPLALMAFAVVMAVVSQLGDLFESAVKRRSGRKESGGIIPGHGGILDRIDGLIFAAVFYLLFQTSLGRELPWW